MDFEQTVMYKLGQIEQGITDIKDTIEKQSAATDARLKPLEATNKRLGWFLGVAAGLGAVFTFAFEKIGLKWLSLLS